MEAETETREQLLEVVIEKMVYGGEGLARTPEGVLLMQGVLAGETGQALAGERHQGVRRAQVKQLLTSSPQRVVPQCAHYGQCGGCHYQHTSYEQQLELKKQILIECFERIGKLTQLNILPTISANPWQYRNRSRWQIMNDASGFAMGYHEHSSHQLCPVKECPISSPYLNATIEILRNGSGKELFPEGKTELEVFASDADRSGLATVWAFGPPPMGFGERLMRAVPGLESVCWINKSTKQRIGWGPGAITYHVGDYHFHIGHEAFFQVNRWLTAQMIEAVIGDIKGREVLDLYAGVGLFSFPLARRFERVTAVENDAEAAKNLQTNLGVVAQQANAVRKNVEQFLMTTDQRWDAVIADPPRLGMSAPVRENLLRVKPNKLVYVSCDPATLARDLKEFVGSSAYQIVSVQMIDQFPQTFHIETVVHLERRE